MSSQTVGEIVEALSVRFTQSHIQCRDPKVHALQMLSSVMEVSQAELISSWSKPVPSSKQETLYSLSRRRLDGEPFQYVMGEEWFWEDRFKVGPGVLIPRRETEHLIDALLELPTTPLRVAELGSGSGNIAITACKLRPDWNWAGFEKNPDSFAFAIENQRALLPGHSNLEFHCADFFESAASKKPWDVIVSNPPYIPTAELNSLPVEVRFEPKLALDGGPKGLDVITDLLRFALDHLNDTGYVFLEIGAGQKSEVLELCAGLQFKSAKVLDDYSQRPRILVARR